jgi:hypothetical protein
MLITPGTGRRRKSKTSDSIFMLDVADREFVRYFVPRSQQAPTAIPVQLSGVDPLVRSSSGMFVPVPAYAPRVGIVDANLDGIPETPVFHSFASNTNLIENSTLNSDALGYETTGGATMARLTLQREVWPTTLQVVMPASGFVRAITRAGGLIVAVGNTVNYHNSVWVKIPTSLVGKIITLGLDFLNAAGVSQGTVELAWTVARIGWTNLTHGVLAAAVPATTARVRPYITTAATGGPHTIELWGWTVIEGQPTVYGGEVIPTDTGRASVESMRVGYALPFPAQAMTILTRIVPIVDYQFSNWSSYTGTLAQWTWGANGLVGGGMISLLAGFSRIQVVRKFPDGVGGIVTLTSTHVMTTKYKAPWDVLNIQHLDGSQEVLVRDGDGIIQPNSGGGSTRTAADVRAVNGFPYSPATLWLGDSGGTV